jgi:hypothetical protein
MKMKAVRHDVRELLEKISEEGWAIKPTQGGHWKCTSPSGDIVFAPGTPSDRRSLLNARAKFRRCGASV